MEKKLIQIKDAIHYRTAYFREQATQHLRRIWWRVFLICFAAWYISHKDMSINLEFNALGNVAPYEEAHTSTVSSSKEKPVAMNTSMLNKRKKSTSGKEAVSAKKTSKKYKGDNNLANTYSNMTYSGSGFATKDSKSAEAIKRKKQLKYVDRYVNLAQKEMEKYGIPASITLAQGLLESNCGESRLAVRNNNHFGVKCFSRSCKKGHCTNFTDDSHKDFFRKYNNVWESYRGHSYLLRADRYKPLYKLDSNDYKGWARGLKKAGYATDKYYAEKLIQIIETFELYKLDA